MFKKNSENNKEIEDAIKNASEKETTHKENEKNKDNELKTESEEGKESEQKETNELTSVKEALEISQKNTDELKKTLQFLQAEFENYKKRQDRDMLDRIKFASSNIIIRLLPTIDEFEHSISNLKSNTKSENNDKCLVDGIEMIYNNLIKILNKEGLEVINPIGEKFDPYLHDAVLMEKSDKKSMIILQVLQKGYKLNDKIIRHAKVKVAQ